MHWVILPSGHALNLAHVAYVREGSPHYYGTDEPITELYFAVPDTRQDATMCCITLTGDDRTALYAHLQSIAGARS